MSKTVGAVQKNEFGPWRSFLWPIHNWELKKFLPMALLFFFISFNYTVLRNTKDVLIVTAEGSGAEAIPFLKLWGVLPFAILFTILYSKLSNILSKPKLFYTMITIFIVFFAIFIMFLYPNRYYLHPTTFAQQLKEVLPVGLHGLVAILQNWTYGLFYIMSELWGSIALSLLFWGFANDITKPSEASRFYGVFGIGANLALLISGPFISFVSKTRSNLPAGSDPWATSLQYLIGGFIVSALAVMAIYWWINAYVLTDTRFYDVTAPKKAKKAKQKMSLKDSFVFLLNSKYIGLLGLLVVSYGIAINLVEVTWKNQLKILFQGNANEYSAFMGQFSSITGAVTIFMMLFVSSNVIRRFGWTTAALFTPVVLLVTGIGFFSFIIFKDSLAGLVALLGTTPLMIGVWIGLIQNVMSKSTKYSLFDPTKEMAYLPLDSESKVKGKAAIDVVGSRLGKSGGALINQGLIVIFSSLSAITPYVAVILFVIIASWIWAAKKLGKLYTEALQKKDTTSEA
jgi:AAA family ATP:ADP antiporter